MCKAPTAAGKTFVYIIFEYYFTGQSETTNKVTDTWAVKKLEHGQPMTVKILAAKAYECTY